MVRVVRPCRRAPFVRARAHGAKALTPPGGAREPRQRQIDPRDARSRHPARRASLLPSCGVGAARPDGVRGLRARGSRGADRALELPPVDGGVESGTGARRWEHRTAQARRVHAAHRALPRRARARGGSAGGSAQRGDGRRPHRRADRQPPRRGQDRVHGLDRGGPHHPESHRRLGQEALARAGRQEPIHRVRRRRPGQRGGGRGGRDLVQPGAGVLRRVASAGARGDRRPAGRQAARAHGKAARGSLARQGVRHGRDRRAGTAQADPDTGDAGSRESLQPTRNAEVGTRNKRRAPGPRSDFRVPRSKQVPPIDRTYKLFIGGAQVRPDQGYSRKILAPSGALLAEVADGNRKDIRNAVEAAHAAAGWAHTSGHNRGQILYYVAEHLAVRSAEFAALIGGMTGEGEAAARSEVEAAVARLFSSAAWADKYDGAVHQTPIRGVTLAMNEAVGVVGIACPEEHPLLGFVSLVAPAVAVGNTVVAVPSEARPLAATELYTVLEASDVPAGVINIVTGAKDALAKVLAEHDDVDAVWYFGNQTAGAEVERASAGNMKRTWVEWEPRDWTEGEGREFLRQATQVKNIWIPYGE